MSRKQIKELVAGTILSLLFLFTGTPLVATFYVLLLVVLILPGRLYLITRALLAYTLFYSYVTAYAIICRLLHVTIQPSLLLLLAIVGVTAYLLVPQTRAKLSIPRFSISDAAIIGVAVMLFLTLIGPIRHQQPESIIRIISSGEDNSSHYALYNTIIENNKITYFGASNSTGTLDNLISYPQALHINMAVNTRILEGAGTIQGGVKVRDFAYQAALYYVFFIVSFLAVIVELSRKYAWKSFVVTAALLSPLLWHYAFFGFSFALFTYGFLTQYAAFGLLLVLFIVTTHFGNKHNWKHLALWATLAMAVSNTWFFVLPIAFIYLLGLVGREFVSVIKNVKSLLPAVLPLALALVPVLAAVTGPGDPGSINSKGAVLPIPMSILIITFLVIFVIPFTTGLKKYVKSTNMFVWFCASCTLFCLCVATYQQMTLGHYEYYFYKSVYILPVLAGIWLFILVLHAISAYNLQRLFPKYVRFLVLVLAVVVLWFTTNGITKSDRLYLYTNKLLYQTASLDIIRQALIENQGRDVLVYKPCAPVVGYINERWTAALLLTDTMKRYPFYTDALLKEDSVQKIAFYTQSKPLVVFYNPLCSTFEDVNGLRSLKNVELKPIDI